MIIKYLTTHICGDYLRSQNGCQRVNMCQYLKIFGNIKANCDWENRKGKFVDFFTMNINGKNNTAYIYEYFLKCDSLRFVLIYDMEQKEPELFKFNIEPIEQASQMIIDPSKQLINQK
jgi:hypothetical protein